MGERLWICLITSVVVKSSPVGGFLFFDDRRVLALGLFSYGYP